MDEFDMYQSMEVSSADDLYFLRMFSEYDSVQNYIPQQKFEHFNTLELTMLRNAFGFKVLRGDEDELRVLSKLKQWAVQFLSFQGMELGARRYDHLDCLEIIKQAKKEGYALNCRYISLIFTQVLLAVGFKARLVCCMSMDLRDTECHWVTEVFVNQLKKWVVIDVPLDFFYFDSRGRLLNLMEMRKLIINGDNIKLFSTNREHILFTQQYWKKNIFRFKFLLENKYNMLASPQKHYLVLNPKNFIMKNKKIINGRKEITTISYYYNNRLFWEGVSYV